MRKAVKEISKAEDFRNQDFIRSRRTISMSSFLRSLCHMVTDVSDPQTTQQLENRGHQIALEDRNQQIVSPGKTAADSCFSCRTALSELQLLRRRLEEGCWCKNRDRTERSDRGGQLENSLSNTGATSTKEEELFGVIDDLKLSLEKAKDKQRSLQQQVIVERALRTETIRLTEELCQTLSRQDNQPMQESSITNDDGNNRITALVTEFERLKSLSSSIADEMDDTKARLSLLCSSCEKKQRPQQPIPPLRSIDRPLKRTTTDDNNDDNNNRINVISSAVTKANNSGTDIIEGHELSPDIRLKRSAGLLTKPATSKNDWSDVHLPVTAGIQLRQSQLTNDIVESEESVSKRSREELRYIKREAIVKERAEENNALKTEKVAVTTPIVTKDSSRTDHLLQSESSEVGISAERNTAAAAAAASRSELTDSNFSLPSKSQSHNKQKKSEGNSGSKNSAKGTNKATTTVTINSRGSLTTYSGSNLSLWMQFGNENEPEKIIAKQMKPSRHQKHKQLDQIFATETKTSIGSSENQRGRSNTQDKREFYMRKFRNRDFVASGRDNRKESSASNECHNERIPRKSRILDNEVAKMWRLNDSQWQKGVPTCKFQSDKCSLSNSSQLSISSNLASNQSTIGKQFTRNQPSSTDDGKELTRLTLDDDMENPDDLQLVLDSVREYCSFQIPVSSPASPDLEQQIDLIALNGSDPSPTFSKSSDDANVVVELSDSEVITEEDADPDSHSASSREYRSYLTKLVEKFQIRKSQERILRSSPGNEECRMSDQLMKDSSAAMTNSEMISAMEKQSNNNESTATSISPAKLHFISDESMLTYLSGIKTNILNKGRSLKASSGPISTQSEGPLSNLEVDKGRLQQSVFDEEMTKVTDEEAQKEEVLESSAPLDSASSASQHELTKDKRVVIMLPFGTNETQSVAQERAKIISDSIRHQFIRLRPISVMPNDENLPKTNKLEQGKVLTLPEAKRIAQKPGLPAKLDAYVQNPGVNFKPFREIITYPVQLYGAPQNPMATGSLAPTSQKPNHQCPMSSVVNHFLISGSRETAKQCDCQSHRTPEVSFLYGSGTQDGEERQNENEADDTTSRRLTDDVIITSSAVRPQPPLDVGMATE